jgi:tetratricopeptide (TPR) repeat protein
MHARTHDALEVFAIHAAEGDTAWRHAALMAGRGRADEAIEILQTRPPDDAHATWLLAQLLVDQGRVDEAIEALRTHADAGDRDTAWRLAALLTVQVRIDDAIDVLRALADVDAAPEADYASRRTYLNEQGDIGNVIGALRTLVDSGDGYAGRRLAALLADRSIEELQAEVDAGTPGAAEYLIKMLTEQDTTSADRLRKFGFNPEGQVGDHNRQASSQ